MKIQPVQNSCYKICLGKIDDLIFVAYDHYDTFYEII